jgi:hypothetical protein
MGNAISLWKHNFADKLLFTGHGNLRSDWLEYIFSSELQTWEYRLNAGVCCLHPPSQKSCLFNFIARMTLFGMEGVSQKEYLSRFITRMTLLGRRVYVSVANVSLWHLYCTVSTTSLAQPNLLGLLNPKAQN